MSAVRMWSELKERGSHYHGKGACVILVGDFNIKVGDLPSTCHRPATNGPDRHQTDGEECIVLERRSDDYMAVHLGTPLGAQQRRTGKRLLNFMDGCDMLVLNGLCVLGEEPAHQTFIGGQLVNGQSVIDYLLISSSFLPHITMPVTNVPDEQQSITSDHTLIYCNVHLPIVLPHTYGYPTIKPSSSASSMPIPASSFPIDPPHYMMHHVHAAGKLEASPQWMSFLQQLKQLLTVYPWSSSSRGGDRDGSGQQQVEQCWQYLRHCIDVAARMSIGVISSSTHSRQCVQKQRKRCTNTSKKKDPSGVRELKLRRKQLAASYGVTDPNDALARAWLNSEKRIVERAIRKHDAERVEAGEQARVNKLIDLHGEVKQWHFWQQLKWMAGIHQQPQIIPTTVLDKSTGQEYMQAEEVRHIWRQLWQQIWQVDVDNSHTKLQAKDDVGTGTAGVSRSSVRLSVDEKRNEHVDSDEMDWEYDDGSHGRDRQQQQQQHEQVGIQDIAADEVSACAASCRVTLSWRR